MKKFVDPYYQGQSKINYVFDELSGEIKKAPAHGWEPEFESTQRAWDEINEDLELTLQEIKAGKQSPLAFHMKKRLMDSKLLSAETGICHFFVKRHLRSPSAWNALKLTTKNKYAKALNIECTKLDQVPERI
ncbi:MAG: hypothetical protein R3A80_00720 [Bdellovibrionota bacterium]